MLEAFGILRSKVEWRRAVQPPAAAIEAAHAERDA
jgi:hypothetical protein